MLTPHAVAANRGVLGAAWRGAKRFALSPRHRRAASPTLRLVAVAFALVAVGKSSAPPPRAEPLHTVATAIEAPAASAARALGAGWWSEHRGRFQSLAVCALASAEVSFLLLSGLSGVGAGLAVAGAALTILMCL